MHILKGHSSYVNSVAWSLDGKVLASGSADNTIRLWDGQTGQLLPTLEGHTEGVTSLTFSWDGRLLALKGDAVRIWRTDKREEIAKVKESLSDLWPPGLAFHPSVPALATLGEKDTVTPIWDLDFATLLGATPTWTSKARLC